VGELKFVWLRTLNISKRNWMRNESDNRATGIFLNSEASQSINPRPASHVAAGITQPVCRRASSKTRELDIFRLIAGIHRMAAAGQVQTVRKIISLRAVQPQRIAGNCRRERQPRVQLQQRAQLPAGHEPGGCVPGPFQTRNLPGSVYDEHLRNIEIRHRSTQSRIEVG
jgi:hypothetical protein